MQISLQCLKSNYNLKPQLDGNDKHMYLLCIAQTKLNVAQCHVLFLALVSHLPLFISVVSHCYTLLAQTLKHTDHAVMNGSKLGNRTLLPCCAQSCMTAIIHPAQVSFSKKQQTPSKSVLPVSIWNVKRARHTRKEHTRYFLHVCVNTTGKYLTTV